MMKARVKPELSKSQRNNKVFCDVSFSLRNYLIMCVKYRLVPEIQHFSECRTNSTWRTRKYQTWYISTSNGNPDAIYTHCPITVTACNFRLSWVHLSKFIKPNSFYYISLEINSIHCYQSHIMCSYTHAIITICKIAEIY